MKILILTTRLNLGGVGVYTLSLANSLKKKGHHVIVGSSGGELLDILTGSSTEHINLPIDTSAEIGPHILASSFKISRLIKQKGIDIIHAQTRVTQVIASLVSKNTGIPFVTTCHGFFKKRLVRFLFPCWGARVIAISDAVRSHLMEDFNIDKGRIRLIYNGIEHEKFLKEHNDKDKENIRKDFGIDGSPVIGLIARLSGIKGHRYLIEAFAIAKKSFPHAQLLLIGEGPPAFKNKLLKMAQELNIGTDVIFCKGCRDTEKPLSVIDVFCMPSLQEGLGLSIIEAMAAGVPVVASDVGGISTLVKDGITGLLCRPADKNSISEAICGMLKEADKASRMAETARVMIIENFTLEAMTEKVIDVYKEALKSKKR